MNNQPVGQTDGRTTDRGTKKKGFFLNYQDYKTLESIIEDYNRENDGTVNFNEMSADEKEILWKIKTVIRNMESVRLRPREEKGE